jgi:hypothetical protein
MKNLAQTFRYSLRRPDFNWPNTVARSAPLGLKPNYFTTTQLDPMRTLRQEQEKGLSSRTSWKAFN